MKTKTSAAVWAAFALVPALAAGAAAAQDADSTGFYGSAGYALIDPRGAASKDLGAVNLRAGYQFNRYLGVEAEGAVGVDDARLTGPGVRGSYGLDYSIGAYGVARYPVTERFDVFARAGVVHAKFKGKGQVGTTVARFSDKDEYFAIGAGAQFNIDRKNGIRADYTRFEGDGLDANVWGLSFVRKF